MRLILASASPRRRELLAAAGLAFEVDPVAADERQLPGETPEVYASRVARDKMHTGRLRHPADAVLAADTVVVVDGVALGKPQHDDDAIGMLTRLSGRAHDVLTGVAIGWPGHEHLAVERTQVWFTALRPEAIQRYVATGEPRDKAGAYAIQGQAGRFVRRIHGSYSNVVGLPIATVLRMLRDLDVTGTGLGVFPR